MLYQGVNASVSERLVVRTAEADTEVATMAIEEDTEEAGMAEVDTADHMADAARGASRRVPSVPPRSHDHAVVLARDRVIANAAVRHLVHRHARVKKIITSMHICAHPLYHIPHVVRLYLSFLFWGFN